MAVHDAVKNRAEVERLLWAHKRIEVLSIAAVCCVVVPLGIHWMGAPWWLSLAVVGTGALILEFLWNLRVEDIGAELYPDPFPEIVQHRTERLMIRRLRRNDGDAVRRSLDDEVVAVNGWPPKTLRTTIRSLTGPSDFGRLGQLCACLASDDEPIVFISLGGASPGDDEEEDEQAVWAIGVWTTADYRGRGYTSEALKGVFEIAHQAGIEHVYLYTSVDNLQMRRTARAAGAAEEKRTPVTLPNGEENEAVVYRHSADKVDGADWTADPPSPEPMALAERRASEIPMFVPAVAVAAFVALIIDFAGLA